MTEIRHRWTVDIDVNDVSITEPAEFRTFFIEDYYRYKAYDMSDIEICVGYAFQVDAYGNCKLVDIVETLDGLNVENTKDFGYDKRRKFTSDDLFKIPYECIQEMAKQHKKCAWKKDSKKPDKKCILKLNV